MKWQRVTASNHAGCVECGRHTVYWRKPVELPAPLVGWLSVSPPRYTDDAGWQWKYHAAPKKHTGATVLATGLCDTVGDAKAAAEASLSLSVSAIIEAIG